MSKALEWLGRLLVFMASGLRPPRESDPNFEVKMARWRGVVQWSIYWNWLAWLIVVGVLLMFSGVVTPAFQMARAEDVAAQIEQVAKHAEAAAKDVASAVDDLKRQVDAFAAESRETRRSQLENQMWAALMDSCVRPPGQRLPFQRRISDLQSQYRVVNRMRPAEAVLTIKRRRISGRQARQRYSTARAR